MGILSLTKTYDTDEVLSAEDLDAFLDSLEAFLNTKNLDNSNFQDNSIDAATKVAAASIANAQMAPASVGTENIQIGAVTAAKLNADVAGTGIVLDESGRLTLNADNSSLEIQENAIRVKNSGVTNAKRADLSTVLGAGFTNANKTTNSTSVVDIPVAGKLGSPQTMPITVTATGGRPLLIWLQSTATKDISTAPPDKPGAIRPDRGSNSFVQIILYEGDTVLAAWRIGENNNRMQITLPCSVVRIVLFPTAGAHTYTLKWYTGGNYASLYSAELRAVEL